MPHARVLIELLYILSGVIAAFAIGWAAAWAYPVGRANIWLVTYISAAIVVLLGIRPVVRAIRGETK
ncbi:hypothetical protein [Sphingomonas spermidinifaciens]|uniref:hypothetical protein n=1 Tax=Sphingomonas spermidinifaciens TaxID=1141889 RepID=UPI001FE7A292|nr:hypothetical protein [Sphingomonas spermidinifaciens]